MEIEGGEEQRMDQSPRKKNVKEVGGLKDGRKDKDLAKEECYILVINGELKKVIDVDEQEMDRVRPYVEPVVQCFNCFMFGHVKGQCKREQKCIICGEKAHGKNLEEVVPQYDRYTNPTTWPSLVHSSVSKYAKQGENMEPRRELTVRNNNKRQDLGTRAE
ncbi:hypothetical protein DMN91_009535, partial [Ooceraea biroi]